MNGRFVTFFHITSCSQWSAQMSSLWPWIMVIQIPMPCYTEDGRRQLEVKTRQYQEDAGMCFGLFGFVSESETRRSKFRRV